MSALPPARVGTTKRRRHSAIRGPDRMDTVEALKAMVLAMAEKAARADALESEVADLKARKADADERIERLTQILKAFDRASRPLRRWSPSSSLSGSRPCHGSPANRSWPRRSVKPSGVVPSSNAF